MQIIRVQRGGEPVKRGIALHRLLSGGDNEDRKWADGDSEWGERGERRGEHRLRKMREKGTDDWRDRMREDGGQRLWKNDWESEERQTE